eukprot:104191_1
MQTYGSRMIIIDGNLFFNTAMAGNLHFNDGMIREDALPAIQRTKMDIDNNAENKKHSDFANDIDTIHTNKSRVNAKKGAEIIWSGYMRKESKYMRKETTRWFTIRRDGKLLCFSNKKSQNLLETFDCAHLTELSTKSWSKTNKKSYGIKLTTPQQTWKLLCNNREERKQWIAAIEAVSDAKHI